MQISKAHYSNLDISKLLLFPSLEPYNCLSFPKVDDKTLTPGTGPLLLDDDKADDSTLEC